MKKTLMLFLLLALFGCAQNRNRFLYMDENGNPVYQAKCDGYLDFGDCLIEAGQTCPSGFNVLMSSEHQDMTFANANISGSVKKSKDFNEFNVPMYATTWNAYSRYMIYSCKNAK